MRSRLQLHEVIDLVLVTLVTLDTLSLKPSAPSRRPSRATSNQVDERDASKTKAD